MLYKAEYLFCTSLLWLYHQHTTLHTSGQCYMRLNTRPVCPPLTVPLTYNLTYFRIWLYEAENSSCTSLPWLYHQHTTLHTSGQYYMRLNTRPVRLSLTVPSIYNLTYFRTELYEAEYSFCMSSPDYVFNIQPYILQDSVIWGWILVLYLSPWLYLQHTTLHTSGQGYMRLKTRPVYLPLIISSTYNLTYFKTVLYEAEYSSCISPPNCTINIQPYVLQDKVICVRQAPGGEWGLFWLRYAGALWQP